MASSALTSASERRQPVIEITGTYYDGRTSAVHVVEVRREEAVLHVRGGGIERSDPLASIAPSARLAGVPYTLRYADGAWLQDRKSTRLNSSHPSISYA